jgi:hypothetical protein
MADAFVRHADALLREVQELATGESVAVPGGDEPLDDERFDAICEAMADFVDIKSPWTLSHSSGVAGLAQGAARRLGLPDSEAHALWRAALLHDIGKVGVSAAAISAGRPPPGCRWRRASCAPRRTPAASTPRPARQCSKRPATPHWPGHAPAGSPSAKSRCCAAWRVAAA